jgi:8-oxo-dGTP pyrophosphatase MutT (NUDIX family)
VSLLIDRLAARLTPEAQRATGEGGRRAAVAVLLHDEPAAGPRVLLMKRAERVGDPWSGHISLPGGRFELTDPDLLATAIRETHEELAIDLTGTRLLGQLAPLHPRTSGPAGIEVTPFVFATTASVEPTCGPEALAAFWLPLEIAASGALDATYTYTPTGMVSGVGMTFPSWSYEGHVIWGLTMRILGDVLATGSDSRP